MDAAATLAIRLIAEVRTKEDARRMWQRVARAWHGIADADRVRIQPYPKLSDHFELACTLHVHEGVSAELAHEHVVSRLGTRWLRLGHSSIWQEGPGARFDADAVRWAHVEKLIERRVA